MNGIINADESRTSQKVDVLECESAQGWYYISRESVVDARRNESSEALCPLPRSYLGSK